MAKKIVKNNAQRINISIPNAVLEQLDKVTESIGLSRSAYITIAVSQKMNTDTMIANLPQLMDLTQKSYDLLEQYPQLKIELNSESTQSE